MSWTVLVGVAEDLRTDAMASLVLVLRLALGINADMYCVELET